VFVAQKELESDEAERGDEENKTLLTVKSENGNGTVVKKVMKGIRTIMPLVVRRP